MHAGVGFVFKDLQRAIKQFNMKQSQLLLFSSSNKDYTGRKMLMPYLMAFGLMNIKLSLNDIKDEEISTGVICVELRDGNKSLGSL